MVINIQEVKDKILKFLDEKGPSLPIPVSKASGLSTMFASAILSELLGEKKIKISNMRIGNSPLYFIPGQEPRLEPFSDNLHGVEKEVFLKLKENKILEDLKQDPATRVALRHLKDFATMVQVNDTIVWKFFTVSNAEVSQLFNRKEIPQIQTPIEGTRIIGQSVWQDIEKEKAKEEIIQAKETINKIAEEITPAHEILKKEQEEILKAQEKPRKTKKIKYIPENLLHLLQEYLKKNNMEFVNIEEADKKEITVMVRTQEIDKPVCIVVAYDKKKLTDKEIINAYKKSLVYKVPFFVIGRADISKKSRELMDAYKSLAKIDKI